MRDARSPRNTLIDLDRKVSRALETGRGITLSPEQLDALADIGLVERLAGAKAKILLEEARWRQTRAASINAEVSGSTSTVAPEGNLPAPTGISSGMIRPAGTSAERARARAMFE